MKRLVSVLMFFSFAVKAQQPIPSSGKIISIKSFKSSFVNERDIFIWLPENYDNTKNRYAVLYMHDGQMLFDSSITWNKQEWQVDETMTSLLRSYKIRNTIVVGIPNAGEERYAEYTPQKVFENLPLGYRDTILNGEKTNSSNSVVEFQIKSDNYLKFIVTELKPYIDSNFRTQKNRENTFIAGSSMGGLISLYAICEYPDIFGGAACMSTHWPVLSYNENNLFPGAINSYLKNKLPSPKHHKIYFDFGNKTLDTLYKPNQKIIDETMTKKGFNASQWKTKEFIGDDHTERSWAKRLHIPLEFLLTK